MGLNPVNGMEVAFAGAAVIVVEHEPDHVTGGLVIGKK